LKEIDMTQDRPRGSGPDVEERRAGEPSRSFKAEDAQGSIEAAGDDSEGAQADATPDATPLKATDDPDSRDATPMRPTEGGVR
jgi:hypothetical protein